MQKAAIARAMGPGQWSALLILLGALAAAPMIAASEATFPWRLLPGLLFIVAAILGIRAGWSRVRSDDAWTAGAGTALVMMQGTMLLPALQSLSAQPYPSCHSTGLLPAAVGGALDAALYGFFFHVAAFMLLVTLGLASAGIAAWRGRWALAAWLGLSIPAWVVVAFASGWMTACSTFLDGSVA